MQWIIVALKLLAGTVLILALPAIAVLVVTLLQRLPGFVVRKPGRRERPGTVVRG
ncbi:hypothetical protein C7405_113112 [Paraburkholderia caballeronis]|nr:hypothetical protein C7405_113112 [Paraburkholderia caballeronis]